MKWLAIRDQMEAVRLFEQKTCSVEDVVGLWEWKSHYIVIIVVDPG